MVSLPARPQGWSVYYEAETTHSSGDLPACDISLLSRVPSEGRRSHADRSSFLPAWLHVTFSVTALGAHKSFC